MSPSSFNLTADNYDVSEVLEDPHQIIVPDYQRDYSWGKEQWRELWDDIYSLTIDRDGHFIGSIVVIEDRSSEIKKYELVDGQQRLTTISIMLCVIRDKFKDKDKFNKISDLVEDFLWTQSRTTGELHQKIMLNKYHNEDFLNILKGNQDRIGDSEIKDAYEFYRERIDSKNLERVQKVYENLINAISLVQIECSSQISAFRLFESLNDKGLDLSAVDLVKNRLLMEANENSNIDSEEVKDLWTLPTLVLLDAETDPFPADS